LKVLERRFPYRVGDTLKFVIFSDVHLGNRLSSIHNFKENLIERYKGEKSTYFLDLGDCCDMITAQTNDRRFQADMMDPAYVGTSCPVDRMIDDYCELVEPIKDRLLVLTDSNHHLEIEHRTGTSPTRRIAYNLWGKDAEKRLLGYAGFLVTHFAYDGNPREGKKYSRTRSLTWALSHGAGGGGRTDGGILTSLGKIADDLDADVACFGHSHQLHAWDRVTLGVDRLALRVVSRKRVRINSGSYLKGYSDDCSTSYVEKKMLKPNCLGHIEFHVRLTRDAMETFYVKRMVE
jgi:hypothetical protein